MSHETIVVIEKDTEVVKVFEGPMGPAGPQGIPGPAGEATISRDTAAGWTAANPVLDAGQLALETDTGLLKIGDGTTAWNSLPYAIQPYDVDLIALAALSGTGLARRTGAGTWTLDTSSYLTGNQVVTVTGDATGSGATSIALTLANSGVSAGTYRSVTVNTKGLVTGGSNPTTLAGFGITDAQPLDADLTAIAGLAGTSGLLRKTGADTWALETTDYTNASNISSGTLAPARLGTTQTLQFGKLGIGTAAASELELDLNGAFGAAPVAVAALEIDASLGNYFTKSITTNSTFTIVNVPSSRVYEFTLRLTISSGSPTVSFGSGFTTVHWENALAPSFANGKTYEISGQTEGSGVWRLKAGTFNG